MTVQGQTRIDGQTVSPMAWKTGDAVSRLLLDVAAGRSLLTASSLTDEGVVLAYEHGLIGLLASGPSPEMRLRVLPTFSRLTARQRVMAAHLRRILESFHGEGVRATVLKGPDLADRIYREPSHRTFTDVDVLVHPADLHRALDILSRDPAVPRIPARGPKADKRNVPITDPSGVRFTLDLHWDLFSYTQLQGVADGATESAWTRGEGPIASNLGPLWHLPDPTILCFLCTHALFDHRFRLILFRDLTEVALRDPAWEEVGRFAHEWGLRSSTYVSLLMASRVTDAPVPPDFLNALRPRTTSIVMTERLLRRTDLVRFDGHRPHPLNLGIVLLHDSAMRRAQLAAHAVVAFPDWKRRVGIGARRQSRVRVDGRSIVVLVTTDRRRGAEVFGERLTEGLRDRGWDATLLALSHDPGGPHVKAALVGEGTPEQLGRLEFGVVRELRKALSRLGTRIVLANGSSTLQYALAATRTLGRPVRVVYSSIGEPLYWIRGSGRRLIQRILLSRTDLVVAVSEATKGQLVDTVGLSDRRVAVAPTGVPNSFFDISPSDVEHTDLRLLFLGNLSREKDPMAALELVHRLSPTWPVHLRFVGEGPLQAGLQARVQQLGLAETISFEGSVDDVGPHLAWADLLVLTSETEGLPGVVLEAAAAGVPAAAFEVGGAAETIQAGVTGALVPPGNVEALVTAVSMLASDGQTLREMGQRARELVAERYTLERAVDRYHQILTEQLDGTRPTTPRPTN